MTRRRILNISAVWLASLLGIRRSSDALAAGSPLTEFRIACCGNEHLGIDQFQKDWKSWQNFDQQTALIEEFKKSGELLSLTRDFHSAPKQWVMVFRDFSAYSRWRSECRRRSTWNLELARSLGYSIEFSVTPKFTFLA